MLLLMCLVFFFWNGLSAVAPKEACVSVVCAPCTPASLSWQHTGPIQQAFEGKFDFYYVVILHICPFNANFRACFKSSSHARKTKKCGYWWSISFCNVIMMSPQNVKCSTTICPLTRITIQYVFTISLWYFIFQCFWIWN